jgi:methyl-galactoside transport system substrate-binding protein
MKKLLSLGLALVMVFGIAAAAMAADLPSVGVTIYKFDDTFMTGVRNAIEEAAKDVATIEIADSQNNQATQTDQVDLFLSKGVNALAINPVDRTAAGVILDKAMAEEVPVVFFNREPLAEDMAKSDTVYYVGARAEESGTMSGQIIADYFTAHPEADKNGDGIIQYVMLKGEPGHQDAELRTEYSIKAIEDAGFQVEKIAEDTAMWDRVKGQDKMAAFLAAHGDAIEAVLANNDDMALGAIEALKAAGYFSEGKFMPVVGVDATAPPWPPSRKARCWAPCSTTRTTRARPRCCWPRCWAPARRSPRTTSPTPSRTVNTSGSPTRK